MAGKRKLKLDPKAAGLDDETRRRRVALADMQKMSIDALAALAVRAGIYTKKGQLTAAYRSSESGSPSPPSRGDERSTGPRHGCSAGARSVRAARVRVR
jgi:hypothetical protein